MPLASHLSLMERAAGAGSWSWDVATRQFDLSDGFRSLMGLESSSAAPSIRQCLNSLDSAARGPVSRALLRCLRAGKSWSLEVNLNAQRGRRRLLAQGEAVFEGGRVVGLRGVVVDIDARHRAEYERNELARRCRSMGDALFVFSATLSPGGTLVDVSEAAVALAGESRDRLVGRRLWLTPWWTYSGEVQMQLHAGIESAAAGEAVRYEVDLMTPRGPLPVEFALRPVFDAQGRVEWLVAEAQDISERQRVAQQLRQSEMRFRALFDHAPIGLAVVGLDGRIQTVNRELSRLLGYSRIQLLAGMNFQQITHVADLDAERECLHRLLAGEVEGYRIDKYFVHRTGRLVRVQLDATLVRDDHGEPLYFVLHIQDLAARDLAGVLPSAERRARA